MRRRRGQPHGHEPSLDGFQIAEMGGELIIVAGCTSGGAPYGTPLADVLRRQEREARNEGWARAKHALREVLELNGLPTSDVGRVTKMGDGVSREVFVADVGLGPGVWKTYAVLLPRRGADPELAARTLRELRLMAKLRGRSFPFRLPVMLGAIAEGEQLTLVRECVRGLPLDLRAGRQGSVRPWEIVAELAAAIHGVAGTEVEDVTIGHATRREHALARLAVFEGLEPAEMRAALAWAREHLPPDEPSALVHGDLLGQNILLALDGPHHVIDWEYAVRGDPAYDLSIVTRGVKRPFQIDDGMKRLLDAYEAHGGRDVRVEHVRAHELCLVAHAYGEALRGRNAQPPSFELDQMRSLVKRLR